MDYTDPRFRLYLNQFGGDATDAPTAPPPPPPETIPPPPDAGTPAGADVMGRFRAGQAQDASERQTVARYALALGLMGNRIDPRMLNQSRGAQDVAQEESLRQSTGLFPATLRKTNAGAAHQEADAALAGAKVPYAGQEAAADAAMKGAHAQLFGQQAAKGAADLEDSEAFRGSLRSGDSTTTALVRHLAQKYGGMDVSGAAGNELYPMLPTLEKGYAAEQAAKARMLMMQGMSAGGALTPDGLDIAALKYLRTGGLPALGRDAQSRARIIARAAEMAKENEQAGSGPGGDIAANNATLHSDQASLGKQTQLLDMTKSWEATGKANLGVLRGISQQLVNGGSPLVNKPLRWLYQNAGGDPTVAKFHAAHAAVVNEYAKILSGATSSAGITDSARHEAEGMLPLDATPGQIAAAADVLEQDAGNRLSALSQGVEATKGRIAGKAPAAAPGVKGGSSQLLQMKFPDGSVKPVHPSRLEDAKKAGAVEVPNG